VLLFLNYILQEAQSRQPDKAFVFIQRSAETGIAAVTINGGQERYFYDSF